MAALSEGRVQTGTLAEARRLAEDFGARSGVAPLAQRDNPNNPVTIDSVRTLRSRDFGTSSFFGFKCQEAGSIINCSNSETGISKTWSVSGRNLTKAERNQFIARHCGPRCAPPLKGPPPPGVKEQIRRYKPRQDSSKKASKCTRAQVIAAKREQARLVQLPLLGDAPNAEIIGAECRPDVIIKRLDGVFEDGWFLVDRPGVGRVLVANPQLCP